MRDAAVEAIERARKVHRRNEHTGDCEHCSARDYPDYSVPYPCQTALALSYEDDESFEDLFRGAPEPEDEPEDEGYDAHAFRCTIRDCDECAGVEGPEPEPYGEHAWMCMSLVCDECAPGR